MNVDSSKPAFGFWQIFCRVLSLFVIAYLLVILVVLIFQRRLIYYPTRIPADAVESVAAEHGFAPWRNSRGQIIGWQMAANGNATGSVLIAHGNAGCALSRDYIAKPIHDAEDVNVYVLEYPGYGARPGSPSKKSFYAAAESAFRQLPAALPKYVVSESLGTGVAGDLAKKFPAQVAGMALLAPYHDLASVAQRHLPWLPAYFLLLDRFNPAAALRHYHGPIKFVVAGADEIIGPGSGEKLYAGYHGPKELEVIPGAHHNEVAAQTPTWWREVFAFWRQHPSATQKK